LPAAPSAASPPLRLEQITFVATHEAAPELRVQAEVALIDEDANKATLQTVDAEWADAFGRPSLRVKCKSGELDLETNDLLATGDVHGQLADGRRFVAPTLRYDPARGMAFTRAPVEILEGPNRVLRGGGLDYFVKDGKLRLTSGAKVEERAPQ
jgi:LPS export ABC transporter protein LptC